MGAVGWKCSPTVDTKVTKLGIFDAVTERLLACVIVRRKSTLVGHFRWKSLETPLALKANRSYLAGTEDKKTPETVYLLRGGEPWLTDE